LCTANLCRSPIAEALFKTAVAQRNLPVDVSSAGFMEAGQESPPEVGAVLSQRGVTFPRHVSRKVSMSELARADLIIGMERSNVREAVVLDPAIWPRTFTLKELARRGTIAPTRVPGQSLDAWLARLGAGRSRAELQGASSIDDVADPYGNTILAYQATLTELDGLIRQVVELIWPSA
jgi:protein-tyrosine phosphatase